MCEFGGLPFSSHKQTNNAGRMGMRDMKDEKKMKEKNRKRSHLA